jgi:hypothetical protein
MIGHEESRAARSLRETPRAEEKNGTQKTQRGACGRVKARNEDTIDSNSERHNIVLANQQRYK